jgi:hypothetical protein
MYLIGKIRSKFRYVDQGVYSLATLLLSLLAPVFYSPEESAELLYFVSFLLLFLAATTAIFVTQMLSMHDAEGRNEKKFLGMFVVCISVAFMVTGVLQLFAGLKEPFFYYFSYIFCLVEFNRRLFLRVGRDGWSLILSVGCFLIVPLSYLLAGVLFAGFWKVAFVIGVVFVIPVFCVSLFVVGVEIPKDCIFLKKIATNGVQSLTSFGLVWMVTQGVFVAFYDVVDGATFVQQKLIFSVLGFFNVFLIVQENKYQPLYSSAVMRGDVSLLKKYDSDVNKEGRVLLGFCALAFVLMIAVDVGYSFSFILFSVYRYFASISKSSVYYFRAVGKYFYLMLSNIFSLIALLVVYFLWGEKISPAYVIPVFFVLHAGVFLMAISFLKIWRSDAERWGF